MRPRVFSRVAVILFALPALSACIGTSPPTHFYVLDPVLTGNVDAISPAIGVGPIRLARYLDRMEVVRRDDDSGLSIATFDMWAEPLGDAITRVVALNLEAELGTASVVRIPWPPGQHIDYQIMISVDRFEADASGQVALLCRWTLLTGKDRDQELVGRRCEYTASGGQTTGGQTQAMNQLLGRLSTDIAAAIRAELSN